VILVDPPSAMLQKRSIFVATATSELPSARGFAIFGRKCLEKSIKLGYDARLASFS
jgi:hypothetical protein